MGGFEGADHVNGLGVALDMYTVTGHCEQLEEDHRRAAAYGIRTVRESIGWRLCEPSPGQFDFERARRIALSARAHGLQVIWSLMHYGTPPDVSLLDDALCDRFARFAAAAAAALAPYSAEAPVYNLINEVGFIAWAVSETNMVHPYRAEDGLGGAEHTERSGYDVKRRLVRAVLVGMEAVRRVDPRARFLHVEPVVHVVAPREQPELQSLAERVCSYQWQVWDMLAGLAEPELGGSPAALDLVGVNYYHSGQWEAGTEKRLSWHLRDARRRPFAALLQETWGRYGRPMIVAETSHCGDGRVDWLDEVASEVRQARSTGVPVHGMCLYPLVDRPDWSNPTHWHHSGLWDVDRVSGSVGAVDLARPPLRRVLSLDYAAALQRWQTALPVPQQQGKTMTCLIVFSHLRWSFVYQRPQHLMSRLSQHYHVVFIEEPLRAEGEPRFDRISHGPDLDVLVPHTPVSAAGFHDDQLSVLEPMLRTFLRDNGIDDYVVWFYTPMALPLLTPLRPRAVVYDCMDELSAFFNAPKQLRQRETALLRTADLVLTGGPALFDAKRDQHPNVHCLPSSVDAPHFSPALLNPASELAYEAEVLHQRIPQPRLGFFGVVDERFDLALLQTLAERHPDWQLVIAGPVVKIDASRLPTASNVHWLGMQTYARLPYLMAAWDVCLMPFAINDATRFISPTKTLEYMAGEKPIVSTPVRDVVGLYGGMVRIAPAGDDFIRACEDALAEEPVQRDQRIAAMRATVERNSWDLTANTIHGLIEAELRKSSPLAIPMRATPTYVPQTVAVAGTRSAHSSHVLSMSVDSGGLNAKAP